MLDWLMEPVNELLDFISDGIYTLIVESFALLVEYLTLKAIEFTIWSIGFSWDVAKAIINDLGLNDSLNSAWNLLPADSVSILSFFGVPNMISIILTALITSYTLKFIPFSGK